MYYPNRYKQGHRSWLLPTGYTLQSRRIARPNRQINPPSTISIKYPLRGDSDLIRRLIDSVFHDYRCLYGPLSHLTPNCPEYTVVNFWLDCLRCGGFFQPKTGSLVRLLKKLAGNQDKLFLAVKPELSPLLTEDFYKDFDAEHRTATGKSLLKRWLKQDQSVPPQLLSFASEFDQAATHNQKKEIKIKYFINPDNLTDLPPDEQYDISLTVYFHPELPIDKDMSPWLAVTRLKDLFTRLLGQISNDHLALLVGLKSNQNALSNFLGDKGFLGYLKSGEITRLQACMLNMSSLWAGEENSLAERLQFLADRARLLPKPRLVNNWGDYRSQLGGRLQSWLSSTTKHFSQLEANLAQIRKGVQTARAAVSSLLDSLPPADTSSPAAQALDSLSKIDRLCSDPNIDQASYNLLCELLSETRRQINWLIQHYPQHPWPSSKSKSKKTARKNADEVDETDEDTINLKLVFPDLSHKLRAYPAFFGESASSRITDFQSSYTRVYSGLSWLEKVLSPFQSLPVVVDTVRRQLSGLDKILNDLPRTPCTAQLEKLLHDSVDMTNGPSRRRLIYVDKSRPDKNIFEEQPLRRNPQDIFDDLLKTYLQIFSGWQSAWQSQKWDELVLIVEITKKIVSIQSEQGLLKPSSLPAPPPEYEKLVAFVNKFDWPTHAKQLGDRLNSLLLSKIKGSLSLCSLQIVTNRAVAQPVGSDQIFRLLIRSNKDPRSEAAGIGKQRSFHVAFTGDCPLTKQYYEYNKGTSWTPFQRKSAAIADIVSSKYQLQFLDWLVYTPKSKKQLAITCAEPSLIAEEDIKIQWDHTSPHSPQYQPYREPRLYINFPFDVLPRTSSVAAPPLHRYLGVDLGEYGVAYAIVEAVPKGERWTLNLLDKGFIYDPQLRKISQVRTSLQKRQKRGTFQEQSMQLANLRHSAARSIKNRLHALALKYQAILVYERQVDNFEAASNRVVKLYKTIKTGDLSRPQAKHDDQASHQTTKADKSSSSKHDQLSKANEKLYLWLWGKNMKDTNTVGCEVSAKATSYFFAGMKFSPYDLQKAEIQITAEKIPGTKSLYKFTFDHPLAPLVGYSETPMPTHPSWQQALYAIKAFSRPPLNTSSESIRYAQLDHQSIPSNLLKIRGNSCGLISPSPNGYELLDADIQAAVNIAVKRFVTTIRTTNDAGLLFSDLVGKYIDSDYPKVKLA